MNLFYKIQVYEDGDVYVTKTTSKSCCDGLLYLESIEELRAELLDYDVREIEEDIKEIESAAMYEEIRCY